MSKEQLIFINKNKRINIIIFCTQLLLFIGFLLVWELLSKNNIINTFIFSSPSNIFKSLFSINNIWLHIFTTLYEVLLTFILGLTIGFILAIIFYSNHILYRIFDPFITIINSLPKVALGPLLIIICGANTTSIIVMGLLINTIISLVTIYNGLNTIDEIKIKLFKSFNASKLQTLNYLIIPNARNIIISSLKINISMSLIGVIMGEFLVSKAGIGYLIIYGTQVFNLNLVYVGIFILCIISFILFKIITLIEKIN